KDNSSSEDDFRLERKENGGGYSEIATIPANMDYYRDSGLDNTKTYTYKVRAKEGVVYSSYSNEDDAQPYQVPGAPGGAVLSDITDEQMRLSWTASSGAVTSYKVERSVDAGGTWLQIIVVRIGVLSYLDKALVPSQTYHYRVRAYGPGGNGAYSDIVNDDTLSRYDLTDFEKWLRKPSLKPCILIEMNPKMVVDNFINTSGNVYEITITERGIKIDEAWEDGTALTEQSSVATVEADAGSFWCDYFNRKLYVHPSGSDNPGLHLIEAGFWLYGTNYQNGEITFNDNNYLNLFSIKNIPDVTQEIKPLFAGSFSIGSGTIKLINPEIEGEHYFDKKYKRYIWRNRKMLILLGDLDESYSNFSTIFTALMNKVVCDDSSFKIFIRDMRKDMNKEFVLNTYEISDFPDLEEDFEGEPIFRLWGKRTKVVPIPIDWTNKKFKFNDGGSNYVAQVKVNDTVKTEDTDYYIDLQRSIITFDKDFTILEEDIIEIYLYGYEDSAGELIDDGAEIFLDIMIDHFGLSLSDLNLDSIYETKKLNTDPISLPIAKNTAFEDIFRTLEHTLRAYLGVDPSNKTFLKSFEEVAPSDSIFIRNHQISKYSEQKDHKSLYKTINVKYNEDLQTQEWSQKSASDSDIEKKFGIDNKIDVNTFFKSPAHAQDLAFEILELVNKPDITLTIPGVVYEKKPGDMIKISRDRFFNIVGSSDELSFRLLRIQKQIQKMKTKIKARLHGGFIFVDNFDDLLRHPDWTDVAGNGSITEASDVLTIAIANGVHGEFWGASTDGPVCTVDLDSSKNLIITVKINTYTVNDLTRAGLYITDSVDGT
ncbi:MAG: fibronectin type III domain-containing protein, partial [Candidatus Aminicenantes bacterium]|nr:fibronectin type III domain-containing protein [Candidatus Aminicenantes bacterium]